MATAKTQQKTSAWLRKRTVTMAIAVLISSALAVTLPHWSTAKGKDHQGAAEPAALKGLPGTDLTENEAILHALNRLGYGPRPGDVERVRQMGLAKWIDQQLHPESIDDSAMSTRLASFPTLTMSSGKLLSEFPRPAAAAKREGVSPEEYRKEQAAKVMMAQVGAAEGLSGGDASDAAAAQGASGAANAPAQDMPAQDQANGGGDDASAFPAKGGKGAKGQGEFGNNMMDYAQMQTPQRIVAELSMAKIDRAVYSERQLYEQMVDFWFNHFNVFAGKGVDRWMLTSYERDTIRPHAMGKFRDLLEATAKSPAMLFYLDNWQSVDPAAWARLQEEQQSRPRRYRVFGGLPPGAQGNPNAQQKKQERGLNENYGREIMELHTLGVDGGYTQTDVTEVARAFTGMDDSHATARSAVLLQRSLARRQAQDSAGS